MYNLAGSRQRTGAAQQPCCLEAGVVARGVTRRWGPCGRRLERLVSAQAHRGGKGGRCLHKYREEAGKAEEEVTARV
eukprot:1161412-Pelagomonas_calceolata.AAC.3